MEDQNERALAAERYRDYADMYRFFGGAMLYELTAEQIDLLAGADLSADDDMDPEAAEGYKWLHTYLSRRGEDARRDLAVDYARIFLAAGVYEGDTAVPYESVFLSEEHILMQEPRDEVVSAYKAWGYAVRDDMNIPEDHAGFEFEFAALLADRIADALEAGEDCSAEVAAQSDFIEKHMLSWLPMLKDRVDTFAELRFYPALMRIECGTLRENLADNTSLLRS